MPNLPNILFLMSDEHRPDVTGYAGNAVIRTPVLDELARTGVVFRNAYAEHVAAWRSWGTVPTPTRITSMPDTAGNSGNRSLWEPAGPHVGR